MTTATHWTLLEDLARDRRCTLMDEAENERRVALATSGQMRDGSLRGAVAASVVALFGLADALASVVRLVAWPT